jgi:superfamily II DNA/RNA helicase
VPPGTVDPSQAFGYLGDLQAWKLAKAKKIADAKEAYLQQKQEEREAKKAERLAEIKQRREEAKQRALERKQRRQERKQKKKEKDKDDGGKKGKDEDDRDKKGKDKDDEDDKDRKRKRDRDRRRRRGGGGGGGGGGFNFGRFFARGGVSPGLRRASSTRYFARGGISSTTMSGPTHVAAGMVDSPALYDLSRTAQSMDATLRNIDRSLQRMPAAFKDGLNYNLENSYATRNAGERMYMQIDDRRSRGGPRISRR